MLKKGNPGIAMVLLLFFASSLSGGNIDKDIGKQIRDFFKDRTFILQNFYIGDNLKYSSEGVLTSGGKPGIWTLDGFITIKKVKVDEHKIELTGERKIWRYDQKKQESYFYMNQGKTKIEIGEFIQKLNAPSFGKAIRRIFLLDVEHFHDKVPSY